LSKKGFDAIRILSKTFKQMSSYDGGNKINKDEFLATLRDMDIVLSKNVADVFCFVNFRN
jgi:hypothetical protein